MKNSLNDLNNHLFAALERLNDESLKGDDLTSEVSRSTAIVGVAESILHNADTQLRAVKILNESGRVGAEAMPETLLPKALLDIGKDKKGTQI